MTDIDIDKLETLRAAATPGEWREVRGEIWGEELFDQYAVVAPTYDCGCLFERGNAAWITAMHNAAPALIAEIKRLRSENERLQMQLAACGVLASCNTSDSLERNRQMHPDFLGASVHAVIEAAQREIKLLAEVRRLRAIEAAARSYMVCAHAGPWEQFTSSLASLEAALAAKDML